jgi:hypothetical protein
MEGAEYALLDGATSGANRAVYFDSKWADVTSGIVAFGFDFIVKTDGETANTNLFRGTFEGTPLYPLIKLNYASNDVWFTCFSGGFESQGVDYVVGTKQEIDVEYYIDGGPGNCTGLSADCDFCGCLYQDGVQTAECDYTSTPASPNIDGMDFFAGSNDYDIKLDRPYACDELPPSGTRCGQSATFSD